MKPDYKRRAFSRAVIAGAVALGLGTPDAGANDLRQLYEVALSRDTTLQIAQAQRDASIEGRPQALAALLASGLRQRVRYP